MHATASQRPGQPVDNLPPRAVATGNLLPPHVTTEGTRRRLLEGGLLLFCDRGYHGVSIREVAKAANISVSSVYAHITTKEEILVELMLAGHQQHNRWLHEALDGAGTDPRKQMDAVVRGHVRMHATYPLLSRLCNRELHALSPVNLESVLSLRHDSESVFMSVIENGVAVGRFHCPDPWLAVAAIGAMGIRVAEWYDVNGGRTVDDVAAAYAQFAIRIVR